jgi:hypothetical protein
VYVYVFVSVNMCGCSSPITSLCIPCYLCSLSVFCIEWEEELPVHFPLPSTKPRDRSVFSSSYSKEEEQQEKEEHEEETEEEQHKDETEEEERDEETEEDTHENNEVTTEDVRHSTPHVGDHEFD